MQRTPSSEKNQQEKPKPRKVERYVPIRPGIAEYLLRGEVSAFEFGVYTIIHLQADYRTGIWHGSAPRIVASAPRGADLRKVQRAIEHLVDLGLLKHFHQHGQRGNFPFLINKFTVRSGALTGQRLNADKSESCRHLVYEPCAESVAESVAEDAPIQEVRSSTNKKKEVSRDRRRLVLSGKALKELEKLNIKTVPIEHKGFVEIVEANPRGEGEDLISWCRRIMDLCDERGEVYRYPGIFFKRFEQAKEDEKRNAGSTPARKGGYDVPEAIYVQA